MIKFNQSKRWKTKEHLKHDRSFQELLHILINDFVENFKFYFFIIYKIYFIFFYYD